MNSYVNLGAWAIVCTQAMQIACGVASAAAVRFPERPIRLVVPFPPGGSNDVLGRYLSAKLSERFGQQVVIDNRGGANGVIGASLVASAPADGYTLLMVSTSWVMNAAIRELPYDVRTSFDPIATIGSSPNSIIVDPQWGVESVQDLVQRAKTKPGAISYASTGVGGFNHFGGELFKMMAGIDLLHIPYKGGGPAMIDVMSGQVPMMFSSITQALPLARQGKLKFIGVGSKERVPVLPDVPTIAESGYPDYDVAVWWGFASPARVTPAAQVVIHREISALLADPDTRKRLLADAAVPLSKTPAEFRKLIAAEIEKWRAVAKTANIVVR